MNLTQTQNEAKTAYLNHQSEQMLALYTQADKNERKAVISHIYAFLPVVSKDEKVFWLKFISKLQKTDENPKPLFPLGQIVMTIGAKEALAESNQLPNEFLAKHQTGDFGIIGKEDWQENLLSIKEGFRILSAYKTTKGEKIWIITESDRSCSTVLLPSEY